MCNVTSSSANEHSGDNNLDIVQLTNNVNILVKTVISITTLIVLNMFIYFIRSIRYFYDRTEEVGNTIFEFIFPMFCCNQTDGDINQTNEISRE